MYRILFIFSQRPHISLSHVCNKIRQVQCDLFSSRDLPDEVIEGAEGTDCKHHHAPAEEFVVEDQDSE